MNQQLRIATLGDYSRYYSALLYGTMEGSILLGAWFRPIDLYSSTPESIEKQIDFFRPHLLFCHCIFNTDLINEELWNVLARAKSKGTVILYHQGDARKYPRYDGDISRFVSGALMNHKLFEPFESMWKVPCTYWPYAAFVQKELVLLKTPEFECDVAFTGGLADDPASVHHYPRTQFIRDLQRESGLNVKVFPNEQIINTRFQTPELSASAEAVLGVQMGVDIPGYIDVRPFQYIGAGALYFHDSESEVEKTFISGEHFVSYKRGNIGSFLDQFKRFTGVNKKEGDKVRLAGWRFCQENHSTKVRVLDAIEFARRLRK
jgi:hypothetical protein